MENYLVVLILSAFILLGALYVHTVDQNKNQIKDELLRHGNEIKKVKLELESTRNELKQAQVEYKSTRKELTEVKVELDTTKKEVKQVEAVLNRTKKEVKQVKVELDTTKKEVKQVKVELDTTKKEVKQVMEELDTSKKDVKQVKVELDTTKEQRKILRAEMIEKDNAFRKEINQIREDVNALPGELNKIKTEISAHRPGFYATLSPHTDLGHIQTIKFDKKLTDVINNYNTNTGVFTVPKDGLYHISCTMFSEGGMLHAEVMQNDQVIGRNFGYSSYVSAAINVVIFCHQGDDIYVRHTSGLGTQRIHGSGYSAFSGFLIH